MASDKKLDELAAASSATAADLMYLLQGGIDKNVSPDKLALATTPLQYAAYISSSTLYNPQTGTTYTLLTTDNGRIVTLNNASPITLTCPAGLGAGFSCLLIQLGGGQVNIIAGAGATANSFSALTHIAGQYAMVTVLAPTANGFILGGQLG